MPPSDSPTSPLRAFGAHRIEHPFEAKIDTRRRRKLRDEARQLPRTPGVYFFHGHDDRLLYIGKSKSLRDRVRSYFADTKQKRPPKLRRLLSEIERMHVRFCGSELEALLLERKLIAELRPILNRQLKRFDVYPYLLLSDETFPRLTLTRAEPVADRILESEEELEEETGLFDYRSNADASLMDAARGALLSRSHLHDGPPSDTLENAPRAGELPGLYLGPFTTPRAAWWTFEAVRSLFPLRSCEGDIVPDVSGRSCFYHELKRCAAPCVGQMDALAYQQLCNDLVRLLHSGQAPQLERLRARMNECAEAWQFEDAAKIKEQIEAIEHVAARLRRLQRMREENNLVITQPALPDQRDLAPRASLFLVQNGIVRRHLCVRDEESEWNGAKAVIQEVFSAPPPAAPFTAKAELDEMMILDRWLMAHGQSGACAWLNERPSRMWATNAMRKSRKWARSQCGLAQVQADQRDLTA